MISLEATPTLCLVFSVSLGLCMVGQSETVEAEVNQIGSFSEA